MDMMDAHGVTEVNLKSGDQGLRLRRGPAAAPQLAAAPAPPPPPVAAVALPPAAPTQSRGEDAPATPASEGGLTINSPTVGTFYVSPTPDDPAFVKVGQQVTPETVVCIVEAMKVFNQIQAECTGTITEVLVANGDAVEFGQPLFRVAP